MISADASCIYLDCNATTPLDPAVAAVMTRLIEGAFGNPHSEHALGWQAAELIEQAREHVAGLIGADPDEITFTSGATEANNHALLGILRTLGDGKWHVLTSAIEHKSVLHTLAYMRGAGVEIEIMPVCRYGRIDSGRFAERLRDDTALVSIGMSNNEIGTIQPIAQLGEFCRDRGVAFHVDAAQAVGKIPVDVVSDNIDLLSLSGHKLYGPKGIGALYISRHSPTKPEPLIHGGAQQNGMRAGTLPTFLCAGLGEACRIASQCMQADATHAEKLCSDLVLNLKRSIPDLEINGPTNHRLPGNLNLRFPGVDADSLLSSLQGRVAASTGSACSAGLIEPSHVLEAIGLDSDAVASSIRFGVGRQTTSEEVLRASELISEKAIRLRSMTKSA